MPDSQRKILLFLAQRRKATKFQLKECLKMSYSTAYDATEKLVSTGLAKVVDEETYKTGLPKRVYGLTQEGVKWVLWVSESWEEKSRIAENWKDLFPENTASWIRFIASIDNETVKNIFSMEALDPKTRGFNFTGFLVSYLLVLDKPHEDALIKKVMSQSDPMIKSKILEGLRRRIETYEEETEKCKKLMFVLTSKNN